jgi:oxepin-CoA hydrolase / 3-oxo-5,6-dehydrosuberyl-CoA semialdehyde dehydrogenase
MMVIPFDVNDADLRNEFFRHLLFDALSALRDDTRPGWGKMTAQQMVEHLIWAVDLSIGKAEAECTFPEVQCERLKAFLYDSRPTPREFQNPALAAGHPTLRYAGAADATAALRREVGLFLDQAVAMPGATRMHPVFGPIAAEEWARSHFKHCYHHLLQFGLISERTNIS